MSNASLIAALLDIEALQQYYHAEDAPGRVPLVVRCPDALCAGISLERLGAPVSFVSDAPADPDAAYLDVTEADVSEDRAILAFTYAVEGISGTAAFAREGDGWVLSESSLVEN